LVPCLTKGQLVRLVPGGERSAPRHGALNVPVPVGFFGAESNPLTARYRLIP